MNDAPPLGMDRPSRPPPPGDGAAGAGAMLRRAREAAGVHLASLAMSLKVPVARLEALESGRIDLLPDPVFARALAASVCRSLRIDPQPVLSKMPRTAMTPAAEPLAQTAPQASSFKPAAQPAAAAAANRSRSASISRPLGIVIVLLLVATAVLIFVPDLDWDRLTGRGPDRSAAAPARTTNPLPAVGGSDDAGAQASTALQQPRPTASAAAPATAAAAPPLRPTSAATTLSAGPASPAAVAAAPAGNDTLLFETSVPAWIQVLDAKGTALVRKTVPANEAVRVSSADLPLRVTVGQAGKTRVSVRGEPMDLAPVARGGVARFEVK